MEKKDTLTKILAVVGTVLAWFPILAPVVISVVALMADHRFRFDYLMPAEFFPVALLGGGLLLWSALRRRSRQKLIVWGLVCAVGLMGASQGLAVVAGLASGATAPTGWWWALALVAIAGYALALVVVGVGGVLVLGDLFKRSR